MNCQKKTVWFWNIKIRLQARKQQIAAHRPNLALHWTCLGLSNEKLYFTCDPCGLSEQGGGLFQVSIVAEMKVLFILCIDNSMWLVTGALPSLGLTWNSYDSSVECWKISFTKWYKPGYKHTQKRYFSKQPTIIITFKTLLWLLLIASGRLKSKLLCGDQITHSGVKIKLFLILGQFWMNSEHVLPVFSSQL